MTIISLRRIALAAASLVAAGAILLVLQWLSASPAQAQPGATTRYVAPIGSDPSNTCANSSTPCRTVQHAVDEAQPGDEIRVAAGIYTSTSVRAGISQVVYISKTVTIRGGYTITNSFADPPDPDRYLTVLNAEGQGRVMVVKVGVFMSILPPAQSATARYRPTRLPKAPVCTCTTVT